MVTWYRKSSSLPSVVIMSIPLRQSLSFFECDAFPMNSWSPTEASAGCKMPLWGIC